MESKPTQAEREAYILEAREAYPTLAPLEATLALALAEAREACSMLAPLAERTAGFRKNRDSL